MRSSSSSRRAASPSQGGRYEPDLFFVPQGGNADGPLVRRYKQLNSGGDIAGMAFGYFGEASTNMHRVLGEVAATLAPKPQREHRVANAATALGVAKGILADGSGEQRPGRARSAGSSPAA
jgi:hypothetical protein